MTFDEDDFNKLSEEEKKAYVQIHLERFNDPERTHWLTTGWPKGLKQFFPALLGLPIERYGRHIKHPLMISAFIGTMIFIHWNALSMGLEQIVREYGFIPSQFSRHSFTTLFTSFLLHGSWFHLLSNAYYFYVFGDDVEDDMTTGAFFRLLIGGHIFGILLHSFLSESVHLPLVGASAGVSALMGYYMVRFPKRQITYMILFFYVWIHVPAGAAFLWKFFWEFLVASSPNGRTTGVAHWAHLGGAFYGIVIAFAAKNKRRTLSNGW